jgi:multiple sugar transport system permease protein
VMARSFPGYLRAKLGTGGWGLVAPAVVAIAFAAALPFAYSVAMSFATVNVRTSSWTWNGFANYAEVLGSARFYHSLWVTARVMLIALPAEVFLGLALALALTERIVAKRLAIVLLILPATIAPIAVAEIWKLILNADYGPLNWLAFWLFGMKPIIWLNDPVFSIYAIIVADVWQWTPFVMLMLYGAMSLIPQDLIDAAKIDGAGYWQRVRYVIVPILLPALMVTVVLRGVDMMKMFELPFIMTNGGPGTETETVGIFIYLTGFYFWKLPQAAVATFFVLIVTSLLVNRYLHRFLRG